MRERGEGGDKTFCWFACHKVHRSLAGYMVSGGWRFNLGVLTEA